MSNEELEERRNAELEFIVCAYAPEEAWCDGASVHRRLKLPCDSSDISIILSLIMPPQYPESEGLEISCSVEDKKDATSAVYRALPKLIEACNEQVLIGEESVFLVLSRADEWIDDSWPDFQAPTAADETAESNVNVGTASSSTVLLGRRLIYSHHIISKIKRGDIHNLTSHYKLTGYMKIGWPGIMIVEGLDEDCNAFYDEIRPWAWKFLVVRGEQQERVRDVDASRRFSEFIETDNMSRVAQHCREVGLEALFRTSMKVYDNEGDEGDENDDDDQVPYGALVHVDHMNDAKGYRKWLRKTAKEVDCFLMLKQSYPNHDFTKRPTIIVACVGEQTQVQQFLKRWRTSRVDVDSRGKACLERMMAVLVEGVLESPSVDWEKAQAEDSVNVSAEYLQDMVESIGKSVWKEVLLNRTSRGGSSANATL